MNEQSAEGSNPLENQGNPTEYNPWRFCVAPMMDWSDVR